MKKLFLIILLGVASYGAFAQSGQTCEWAKNVKSGFMFYSDMRETWLYSSTLDLPFTVYFFPDRQENLTLEDAPSFTMDFGCNGVYTENAQLFVDAAASYGITFPRPYGTFALKTADNGLKYFSMSFPKDLAASLGIIGLDSNMDLPVYCKMESDIIGKVTTSLDSLGQTVVLPPTEAEKDCSFSAQTITLDTDYSVRGAEVSYYHYHVTDTTHALYALWKADDDENVRVTFNIECNVMNFQSSMEVELFDRLSVPILEREVIAQLYQYNFTDIYFKVISWGDGSLQFSAQQVQVPTEIQQVEKNSLSVATLGGGMLQVSTTARQHVQLFTITGEMVHESDVDAQELLTLNLPQGVYIVKGESEVQKAIVY